MGFTTHPYTQLAISSSTFRYTDAIAIEAENGDITTKGVPIGAASWLRSLRDCRWLLVDKGDSSLELAAASLSPALSASINFMASPAIYAPAVLKPRQDGRSIPRGLLGVVCPIWKAPEGEREEEEEVLMEPGLLSAMGVKQALDEGTFDVSVYLYIYIYICLKSFDA